MFSQFATIGINKPFLLCCQTDRAMTSKKIIVYSFRGCLTGHLFFTWVVWGEDKVSGSAMASGDFFKLSEITAGPLQSFSKTQFCFFSFLAYTVMPVLTIILTLINKKQGLLPFVTGAFSLSLVTVYILFTDFGAGNPFGLMKPGIWLHLLSAIGLIVFAVPRSLLKKLGWIIAGPVLVFASFKLIEKKYHE